MRRREKINYSNISIKPYISKAVHSIHNYYVTTKSKFRDHGNKNSQRAKKLMFVLYAMKKDYVCCKDKK